MTSRQKDFDASLEDDSWIITDEFVQRYFAAKSWNTETLKNMLRQGNSIKLVYSKAAADNDNKNESSSEAANHNNHNNKNHVYLFARSDTLLLRPIPIPCDGMASENDIYLPSWQVVADEHVDRLAMAGRTAASIYAEAKTATIIQRLAADSDKKNENSASLRNAEKILKLWLDRPSNNDLLRVHVMPENWAPLVRVRGKNQVLNTRDYDTHIGRPSRIGYVLVVMLLLLVAMLSGVVVLCLFYNRRRSVCLRRHIKS